MQNRFEGPYQDGLDWMCVKVQSPLGPVRLARKLPASKGRNQSRPRLGPAASDLIIRRFEPSNPPASATSRLRSRR